VHSSDWMRQAACRGTPLYLWTTSPHKLTDSERALILNFCGHCPVADECMRHAIDTQAVGVTQAGRWWTVRQFRHNHRTGWRHGSVAIPKHIPGITFDDVVLHSIKPNP
jgi:hypothetical protein